MPDYWKIMSDGFKDGKLMAITLGNFSRDMGTTIRFSDTQLQRYAFRIVDGRIQSPRDGSNVSTMGYSSHSKGGIAAFVVGLDGTLYLFNHLNKTDHVAHSSFVGKFAKAAGEIVIVDGKISLIHAHSGHFRPNALNMYHIVKHFTDLGVMGVSAKVGFVSNPFMGTGLVAPPYAASLPFECILDDDELRTLRSSEAFVREVQPMVDSIQLSLAQLNFPAYKEERLKTLSEQIQSLKKTLKENTNVSDMTEFELEMAELEFTDTSNLDEERHRRQLTEQLTEMKKDILLQQDLIDAVNSRREVINVVFEVPVFRGFVEENIITLRGTIKPAFFDASL